MGRDLRAEELVERLSARADDPAWSSLPVFPPLPRMGDATRLHQHAGLAYAHAHWALPDHYVADPSRVHGWRRLARRAKRAAASVVFRALRRYLHEERELLGHLVRLNDAMAARCDALSDAYDRLAEELDDRLGMVTQSIEELMVQLHHRTMADRASKEKGPTADAGTNHVGVPARAELGTRDPHGA